MCLELRFYTSILKNVGFFFFSGFLWLDLTSEDGFGLKVGVFVVGMVGDGLRKRELWLLWLNLK